MNDFQMISADLAEQLTPRIEATYAELESLAGYPFARDPYQVRDLLMEKVGQPVANSQ